MLRLGCLVILGCAVTGLRKSRRKAQSLRPRQPLESSPILLPEHYDAVVEAATNEFAYKLVVKFADDAKVRLDGSASALETEDTKCLADTDRVSSTLGLKFSPVFDAIDPSLDDLLERAEVASGLAQPDLHAVFNVGLSVADGEHLVAAAKRLDELACVEYVSIQEVAPPPPPQEVQPMQVCHSSTSADNSIPSFVDRQGYRRAGQLDADFVQQLGADGTGIRYTDCEWGVALNHVDLAAANITLLYNPMNENDDHGTASMAITLGQPGFGVKGLAYNADAYFSPEWGQPWRRPDSVKDAIAGSRAGDVVLLEMQTSQPYGPAELDQTIWSLVKAGSDAGVVIVAAAGNGERNLDGSADAGYRARGDSGSIIVGAGTPSHNRAYFSTYGSRVDVQAWGDWSVMTAGYGVCSGFDGSSNVNRMYTSEFSGTSSASAIVAGAVTLLQSWALRELGAPLAPQQLREVLKSTGYPQQGGASRNVGPHINLRAAVEMLGDMPTPAPTPPPPPGSWSVTGSGCTLSGNCVQSNGHPGSYGNDEACFIQVWAVALTVEEFSTESGYDYLTMSDGNAYSGSNGPPSGTYSGRISWASDYSVTNSGWKLCKA